jgi:hypothetical protein
LCLYAAIQVTVFQLVNVTPRLDDVSPQCGCFQPYCLCPAAGGISTFKPRQPVRHFMDCIAQCADQQHGLGIIAFTHHH